jgi:hypothetical protein
MSKSKTKTLKGLKRGYVATLKTKVFNFGEGRHKYEVYEVTGKHIDKPRYFVDEESVRMFVTVVDTETALDKAAKELSELVPDLETVVPAAIRDSQATRPEDTDK